MNLEKIILKNLFNEEQYTRKILPYLKNEYFLDRQERLIFDEIREYVLKYNHLPTFEAIEVTVDEKEGLYEGDVKGCIDILQELKNSDETSDVMWLVEQTEKFCQEKALHNAILNSIHILEGKDKQKTKGSIPQLLTDALSISFDPNIGHDYIDDAEARYDFYHKIEKRIPFDLDFFNKVTRGGLPQKTLNIALAGCVHPSTKVRIRIRRG